EAGLPKQVSSVRGFMRGELGLDLWDVAMLDRGLWNRRADNVSVAPYFPMLTQGWSLLRAYNCEVPRTIAPAASHLRSAIWSSFAEPGMNIIERGLPAL